jgi:PPM family protein phosphatase
MDLFRRLFGKPNHHPTKTESSVEIPTTSGLQKEIKTAETTEISADAKTQPLNEVPEPVYKAPATAPLAAAPLSSVLDGVTRPLGPEKLGTISHEHMAFGQATDVGLVRTNNQDSVLSLFMTSRSSDDRPDFGLFIVADGMGGHHDGEKASAITTRVVAAQLASSVYLPMLANTNDADRPPITEALIAAVQKANMDVIQLVPEGGTTVSAVAVIGDLAHIAHVGDSRVYLVTKESAEQLTRDHSLVQRLIELGNLTPEEAAEHPQKNVLYRAIGQHENLDVDTLTRRLQPDSRILVCSDGLWGLVSEAEIRTIVMEHHPQEACDKLVALANTRGGMDNITVIILKVPK